MGPFFMLLRNEELHHGNRSRDRAAAGSLCSGNHPANRIGQFHGPGRPRIGRTQSPGRRVPLHPRPLASEFESAFCTARRTGGAGRSAPGGIARPAGETCRVDVWRAHGQQRARRWVSLPWSRLHPAHRQGSVSRGRRSVETRPGRAPRTGRTTGKCVADRNLVLAAQCAASGQTRCACSRRCDQWGRPAEWTG